MTTTVLYVTYLFESAAVCNHVWLFVGCMPLGQVGAPTTVAERTPKTVATYSDRP